MFIGKGNGMEYINAKQMLVPTQDQLWFGTDYTMNIYKGCSHGCIYCDSRSRCYGIIEFDKVKVKENALELLQKELRSRQKKGIIGCGSMSDPYNPLEKELRLSRGGLELINENGFGVSVTTKSPLVTRDIDILQQIKAHSPVICGITITTGDDTVCKKIEPHVASSTERFEALRKLADAGIFCGVLLTPILPFITDTEENIVYIVRKAKEAGVKFVYPTLGVTLRDNQREYYYGKLDKEFPGLRELYEKEYGESYYCGTKNSIALHEVLKRECKKAGILYNMQQIVSSAKQQYEFDQISFLDHVDFFS